LHLPFQHSQKLAYEQKNSKHEKQFQKLAKSKHKPLDDQKTRTSAGTTLHHHHPQARKKKY
jgi:hypothetical protein